MCRVLFFLPYVAMPVAVALVWRLIYNGDFGVLNWLLGLVRHSWRLLAVNRMGGAVGSRHQWGCG